MLACNCLNVIIEVQANDFQKVNLEDLNLAEEDLLDSFFKQDIQQIGKLININKVHSGLIETRNVGTWIVHYCINCGTHSHAVHREKGASCVLINSQLLTYEKIQVLKSSHLFSKLFSVVVYPNELDTDDKILNSYVSNSLEPIVKGLKQIASDGLKKEALAVEDRIKKYTEEQYYQLDILREKTFKEAHALIRVILKHTKGNLNPDSTNSTISNLKEMPSHINEPLGASSCNNSNNKVKSKRQMSSNPRDCPDLVNDSTNETLLFEFDDVETQGNLNAMEEIDNDENKDDNKTSRNRNESNNNIIARSLPMNIPAFMSKKSRANDIDDVLSTEENLDIAASIKALAKSVHSDTIFGDLPRPRFSTQI